MCRTSTNLRCPSPPSFVAVRLHVVLRRVVPATSSALLQTENSSNLFCQRRSSMLPLRPWGGETTSPPTARLPSLIFLSARFLEPRGLPAWCTDPRSARLAVSDDAPVVSSVDHPPLSLTTSLHPPPSSTSAFRLTSPTVVLFPSGTAGREPRPMLVRRAPLRPSQELVLPVPHHLASQRRLY